MDPIDAKLGSSFFRFIDTPGETEHIDKRREAYRIAQISKSVGIINVVSYGHYEGLAPLSEAIKDGKASQEFLEMRQKVEENMIREWTPFLCGQGGSAKWLITVVTKADLWWEEGPDQKVLAYYRNGQYATLMRPEIGNLPHSVHSYSSHDQLFYGMVPMSGYYEEKQRIADRDAFITRLLGNTNGQPITSPTRL